MPVTSADSTDSLRSLDVVDEASIQLTSAARRFQDAVRGHLVTPDRAQAIALELDRLTAEMESAGAEDPLGEMNLEPGWKGTGQTMVPLFEVTTADSDSIHGTVAFPRFYLGAGVAVHGGALSLWVDDVLGRLALGMSANLTRTAYLHIEFLKLVPVGQPMNFSAWVETRDGRKRNLRANLSVGGEVAVEANGLWIETQVATR